MAACPAPLRVVLYRRFMVRIAEALAARHARQGAGHRREPGPGGLADPRQHGRDRRGRPPAPCCGRWWAWTRRRSRPQARRIGTFEVSTLPDQDCCQLFVPSSPATAARLAEVRRAEQAWTSRRWWRRPCARRWKSASRSRRWPRTSRTAARRYNPAVPPEARAWSLLARAVRRARRAARRQGGPGAGPLLIAGEEYPALEMPRYLARLEQMGRGARRPRRQRRERRGARGAERLSLRARRASAATARTTTIPRNSFLNDVLDRRTGIPITLSTVYIEVARRAGLDVGRRGAARPLHRQGAGGGRGPAGGSVPRRARCCPRRTARSGWTASTAGRVRLDARHAGPCARKEHPGPHAAQPEGHLLKAEDSRARLARARPAAALDPAAGEDLRDRGLLYAALDCYGLAAADLEAYLELLPGAPEAARAAREDRGAARARPRA